MAIEVVAGGSERAPAVQSVQTPIAVEAAELRDEIVEALYQAGGGHYGGSLSVLDILLTLYRRILRVAPGIPDHPARDRLILSKGHAAIALYAVLRRLGYFQVPLSSYGQVGSRLQGHPDMTLLEGIDFSSGSLGQGLSVGLGMALASQQADRHVWVVLGDGECQEGQIWEAAMVAARHRLDGLHAVIDANGFQECALPDRQGRSGPPVDRLEARWRAFGWRVLNVDGHHHESLSRCLADAARPLGRPSIVIAHTVKGKGYPLLERDPAKFHCATLSHHEHSELIDCGC